MWFAAHRVKARSMAIPLMSAAEFIKASYCFMTLHTGERVEYDIVTRTVKMMRGNGGIADVPMIKICKRGNRLDSGGWYTMNALTYVMPDGSLRR